MEKKRRRCRSAAGRVAVAAVCVCALACSKTDRIHIRAVLGSADAEAELAEMHFRGEGRPKDLT